MSYLFRHNIKNHQPVFIKPQKQTLILSTETPASKQENKPLNTLSAGLI